MADLFESLPTDREVLERAYGIPNGPVGIYLEPCIAGYLNSAPGFDEAAFLARPSLFETLDATTIERSKITITKTGKTALNYLEGDEYISNAS